MVITLAIDNSRNAADPITLVENFFTSIPPEKLPIPAHTASNAVAIETEVGSNPLSMNAGILCSAKVRIPRVRIENARVNNHIEGVFIASLKVNECSVFVWMS